MAELNFKYISFCNFLSVGQVPIVIDLSEPAAFLIVGVNGAGKSTIVDAITYALFGKPYRKINKPQLVNSINKKNMLVELVFEKSSHTYKIRRGMAPNIFEIYVDDVLIDQESTAADYQKTFEKNILKMSYATGKQIVLLSKTSYKPFMELDAKERRLFIEDLLSIEVYSEMSKLLSKRMTEISTRAKDLQKDLAHTKEKIEIIRSNVARFVQNNDELIKTKEDKISQYENSLKELRKNIKANEEELDSFSKDYRTKLSELKAKREKFSDLKNKIITRRAPAVKEVAFFEHTAQCPTCEQQIEESYRLEAIRTRREAINDYDMGVKEAESRIERVNAKIEGLKDQSDHINDLNNALTEARTNINFFNTSIRSLQKEIEDLKEHCNDYETDYKLIDELNAKKQKLVDEKNQIIETTNLYKSASILLRDGGIKAQIIKQYIPIINKYINKYLASMDFYVQFELDENFDEVIHSRYRDVYSYGSFSEGEKFRIDLALMLTWRTMAKLRNSSDSSILFLDEIFDGSLDDSGIEDFLNLIDVLVSEGTGIYVISHRGDNLKDKFENVLEFEKVRNFTQKKED